jgi:hypothetical protein
MSRILEVDTQWQTMYYYSVCATQCIQLIPGTTLELFIIIIINSKWVFTWWQWYYSKDTSHKITHRGQTKHSTQNYTNNKGHTTHNKYDANTITTTII